MLSAKTKSNIFIAIIISLMCMQEISAQTATDSIFLSAMRDELNRSMSELEKKDHDKPFFISYTIADIKAVNASAKYGALTSSGENQYKDWNVRVMVGDYELNDENFTSDIRQNQENRMVYNMPLENDYMGIRMALWSQTDMVYNSAAKLYKQKRLLIDEKRVDEKLLGKHDFSRAQVVKIHIQNTRQQLSLQEAEKRVKDISEVFNNLPEIYSSGVSISHISANVYFLNSENTEIVYPLSYSTITVSLNVINEKDENFSRNLIYKSTSSINLPENKNIFNDIEYMIKDIKEEQALERFEDDYSGPVLFAGESVASVVESALFTNGKKIIASRKPLKRNDQYAPDYNYETKKRNWKIGKMVIDKNINVTDYSSLSNFKDKQLWGNYKVDAEGVIPADSLVLIKNGILMNKYNDRTPADDVEKSNGHKRHAIGLMGVSKTIAPGVLKISSTNNTMTYEDLKKKLITLAIEDGYEYGILIKPAPVSANNAPNQIYKVDVETGKEIRLRGASYNSINDREFKNIGGSSNELIAINKTFGGNGVSIPNLSFTPQSGVPVTYIVPSAILINRVDISSSDINFPVKKPIIDSPLIAN